MNDDSPWLVTCLCAGWCGSCRDYGATFDTAAASVAGPARWQWIDIEDDAALLDGVDVENFPTLLIQRGEQVMFFGPVTPQPQTLTRIVGSALAGDLPAIVAAPDVAALARRLAARGPT